MNYRNIGNSGISVSEIGLGTWQAGGQGWGSVNDLELVAAIRQSVDCGVTLIDTAPVYGAGHSEEVVGRAISDIREKVVLSTKCGLLIDHGGRHSLSPVDIRRELDASRRRLNTDWIDIYFCHWPDPSTPIEATVDALMKLKNDGLIRCVGLSNHSPQLVRRACAVGQIGCIQEHYSLLKQDSPFVSGPVCKDCGIAMIAYGTLGGGILSGKYKRRPQFVRSDVRSFFYPFFREPQWSSASPIVTELNRIADRNASTPAAVAIFWAKSHNEITSVLVGAKNASQAIANAASSQLRISPDDLVTLTDLSLLAARSIEGAVGSD